MTAIGSVGTGSDDGLNNAEHRQGLRAVHEPAAVVCALSDFALIVAGVLGAGTFLSRQPGFLPVACSAGPAFLLGYGLLAARRALRPGQFTAGARAQQHHVIHRSRLRRPPAPAGVRAQPPGTPSTE